MKIRILSWNIHKGLNWNNTKHTLPMIKQKVFEENIDIVFLQEVLGKHQGLKDKFDNWPSNGQFEYLADSMWPHYAYGKNAAYTKGHHGNAILSKHPIHLWKNWNITINRFEKRGLLYAKIYINDNKSIPIHLFSLHLNLLHWEREKQYEQIKSILEEDEYLKEPIIVCGDFNDYNHASSKLFVDYYKMEETHKYIHGYFAKSFPSYYPMLALDRIYVKWIRPISSKVGDKNLWKEFSDHLPLICELEI